MERPADGDGRPDDHLGGSGDGGRWDSGPGRQVDRRRAQHDPVTLEELAGQYGVSRERVRQIEVRAFEKLQKAMRAAAEERNLVDA